MTIADRTFADYRQVYPNLFVGSAPIVLPLGFDVVVFAASEHQPEWGGGTGQTIVMLPLDDVKPSRGAVAQVIRVATYLADVIGRSDRRVLVTCHQGLNRSAWVAGMTMRLLGVSFRSVVRRIRAARGPDALSNRWFLASLEEV
jgi:hypothetical protein